MSIAVANAFFDPLGQRVAALLEIGPGCLASGRREHIHDGTNIEADAARVDTPEVVWICATHQTGPPEWRDVELRTLPVNGRRGKLQDTHSNLIHHLVQGWRLVVYCWANVAGIARATAACRCARSRTVPYTRQPRGKLQLNTKSTYPARQTALRQAAWTVGAAGSKLHKHTTAAAAS